MADPNEVYPTGLISTEAEELHDYVISGPVFAIALMAHVLA